MGPSQPKLPLEASQQTGTRESPVGTGIEDSSQPFGLLLSKATHKEEGAEEEGLRRRRTAPHISGGVREVESSGSAPKKPQEELSMCLKHLPRERPLASRSLYASCSWKEVGAVCGSHTSSQARAR